MSEHTVIECNKYKFVRFPYFSGFIAFDKLKNSVGFDEVCKYIDELEDQLTTANKRIEVLEEACNLLIEGERKSEIGVGPKLYGLIEALAKSKQIGETE